ncbi:MAG: ATP-binding protein [Litorilinea sp.]
MAVRQRYAGLSAEELQQLMDAGPNDRMAFLGVKSSQRAIAETLAALANANGGLVVLGVTGKGVPQADVDPAALAETVAQAARLTDPPLVLPSPHAPDLEKGKVLAAEVPAGLPHIFSVQGLFLTRTAGRNRPLTTPELRRLLLERGDAGYEAQIVDGASMDDLDEKRIVRYLDQVSFAATEDIAQALIARGCLTQRGDGELQPTVGGILLFGLNPQRFFRSAEIICVRYTGKDMGDEFVRQDIGGTLADQIRQAEAFVASNMRRGMKITGFTREETAEYPMPVVREAIVNAVAHRDYTVRGEGVRILMFSDRMEIYSPGRLPGHVTLENLKDERYSRNESIVAVLSDLGYIERLGYGIDRMITTMQETGLPEPIFAETAAGFQVTLYSRTEPATARGLRGGTRTGAPDNAGADEPLPAATPPFLNERQEQALAHIAEHGRITNSDYQALIPDVSAETIRRDLADLVERNLLLRIGEKRATYYILK